VRLSLIDALRVAAFNSRDYQSQKENVYRAALGLDLERHQFENTFAGSVSGRYVDDLNDGPDTRGFEGSGSFSVTRRLQNGMVLTGRIGLDLVKLLTADKGSSGAIQTDFSIEVPLMRGSGRHIVGEPLLQAERDAVYAIYDFERFKRSFAVQVASNYLSVLRSRDSVENAEQNYRRRILLWRQSRARAEAGQVPEFEVSRTVQDRLSARDSWISAQQSYQQSLDNFKNLLGLPTDALIELEQQELDVLAAGVADVLERMRSKAVELEAAAEAIALDPQAPLPTFSREDAGPMELDEATAVALAFEHRLDLRITEGNVYDAQRRVIVAADALRAELTLLGRAAAGEGRSLGSADEDDAYDPRFDQGTYDALLTLDLPLERTRERNAYRNSLIELERAVRDLQDLEDGIKSDVRNNLRNLLQSRESLLIQSQAVAIAERRVRQTELLYNDGRIEVREVQDAQNDLIDAQDALTSALVNYRIAELEMQRDMDVLEVNEQGIWKEFDPEEVRDDDADEATLN
jgi:outer membrane protein TolC